MECIRKSNRCHQYIRYFKRCTFCNALKVAVPANRRNVLYSEHRGRKYLFRAAEKGERTGLHLGRRVRNLREMRGLGLNELARAARISPGYLSQLESGQRANPSIEVLQRLARALDVTVQYLAEPRSAYDPPPVLQDESIMLRERKYAGLSPSDREDLDELLNVKWKRRLFQEHEWLKRLSEDLSDRIADLIALYGLNAVLEAGGVDAASVQGLPEPELAAFARRAIEALR